MRGKIITASDVGATARINDVRKLLERNDFRAA
jgi:hypothetical protein